MEDAATAEICRAQVWQWVNQGVELQDGRTVTRELVREMLEEEMRRIRAEVGEDVWQRGRPETTRELFEANALDEDFPEFLTLSAYEQLD